MTRPIRAALPPLLLLLASPALGQTSLGQPGSLPPPRPAAPATAPGAPPPAAVPRPQAQPAPARPQAAPPRPPAAPQAAAPAPRPPAPAAAPPRPATPTLQQRPGTSNSAQPARPAQGQAANANRRRAAGTAAGVAAGAAAGAAGAAALGAARPPEAAPPPPPKPMVGSATGLPLPRFAALGSNQVNLRIGPDLRYRIEWTYQRKDLPVQIVEEHQIWRRIRDPEGTEGWVQRPLLASRRTFLVQGEERVLRRRPEENSDPVARLKPGVIGAIRKCEVASPWCEARVGEYGGWIRRSEIWGVAPDEAVN